MNEEIEKYIKNIQKSIELWDIIKIKENESENKIHTAKDLCYQLTMLKLMIGINNFQNLHYFNLYDQEVVQFLVSNYNSKKM
jgi:hypothetical protein